MELSAEEKWKRSRAALSMLLGTSIKAISKSYGKEGLEQVDFTDSIYQDPSQRETLAAKLSSR